MTVIVKQLLDEKTGQNFVPVTHWDAISNKPNIEGSLNSINTSLNTLDTSVKELETNVDNLDEFTCETIVPTTTNFVEDTSYTIHEALQRTANLFSGFQGEIDDINGLIPNQATEQNQLADKDFVNSTVATNAANFRGNWADWGSVPIDASYYPEDYVGNRTPNNNDYMVVSDVDDYVNPNFIDNPENIVIRKSSVDYPYGLDITIGNTTTHYNYTTFINKWVPLTETGWISIMYLAGSPGAYSIKSNVTYYVDNAQKTGQILLLYATAAVGTTYYISKDAGVAPIQLEGSWRFIYIGDWTIASKGGWKPQYQIGSTFTAAQQAAIDSGITSTKVTTYDGYGTDITALQTDKLDKNYTANKIYGTDELGAQTVYTLGTNIEITNNTIKAVGYRYDTTNGAFAEGDRDIVNGSTTKTKSVATGAMAHAEGTNCTASGNYSHAEGQSSTASAVNSHAEGLETTASGLQGHAEGYRTTASSNNTHAEGQSTQATVRAAHSEGMNSLAGGIASHTEGYNTETGGNYTSNTKTAGTETNAGSYSHAEGNATLVTGRASHTEGHLCFVSANNAHAEGYNNVVAGNQSHAEGSNNTINSTATQSHAEGARGVLDGSNSHTEGYYGITTSFGEHMEGTYNVSHHAADVNYLDAGNTRHSIGIGNANDARKNAVEVMQNGDTYLLGIGNYDGIHIKGETGAPTGLKTLQEAISGKQDTLTAGTNIDITNNVISATGTAATVTVGTTTTGNAGTSASVTNSGTSSAAVLNFTIPIGNTGATGEDGTRIFIGSTEADELVSLYDPNMRVGDFIIDDGLGKEGRRGNIYQIDAISSGEYPVVTVTDTGSNILGPVGAAGSSAYWFSGTAVTETGTSIVVSVPGSKAGDMYLNTNNYNVYKATAANTWNYICNIKGILGNAGTVICTGNTFNDDTIDTVDYAGDLQIGDLVIDGGGDVPERKGNIYSISSISSGTYYVLFTGINIIGPSQGGTDTKNTAGATNNTSKLYLVGALSLDTYPQTYSNSSVYATNGTLHASKLEIGSGTASGTNSVIEGNDNYVSGSYSHVEGSGNRSTGYTSHVEGASNYNFYSAQGHVEGYLNTAHNERSHVEGSRNAASGQDSHAEGCLGSYMISFECEVTSVNTSSRDIIAAPLIPISNISSTSGFYDKYHLSNGTSVSIHSLIVRTSDVTFSVSSSSATLPSVGDHIVIYNSLKGARGLASHCEGYNCGALGAYSHAEGYITQASGSGSHAEGSFTIANGANQLAIGTYNVKDTLNQYAFIIGNGDAEERRSNALTVDWDGNLNATNNITATGVYQTSDYRKKTIKKEIDLDKCYQLIDKCQTIVYNWKNDISSDLIGMIAQEVLEFFPEIVNVDEFGYLSLDYSKLVVICIRVLKEIIDKMKLHGLY